MKEAANGVEATGTDKEANNAEMIAAVKAAVAEALAEAQPDPAPEPTVAPDPEPSTAPDPGTDTNYSGILGLILSAINAIASGIWDFFSHPIENITNGITGILEMFPQVNALIQALPAAVYGFFQDPLGAISTGISKGGQTTMLYRAFFPDDVDFSVPYVGPLCKGVEDGRHEPFLRKVGTKAERERIQDFQLEVLKRKSDMLPLLESYCCLLYTSDAADE